MKTHRICLKCGERVKREYKIKEYPFYCPNCDENLYRFETQNVKKNHKKCYFLLDK